MDPQIRRRRTFEALKKLFLRESLNQPLILIFEDLHWIDSETQGFLDVLSESVATARFLLLVNYRPEYRHEWGSKTYYTQLRLAPLGKAEAEELLTVLLGDDARASGRSPLRASSTSSWRRPKARRSSWKRSCRRWLNRASWCATRWRAGFHTRLSNHLTDRVASPAHRARGPGCAHRPPGPRRESPAPTLAVIGREFPLSLLTRVVDQPEDELYRLLAHLRAAEFLYEQPAFPEAEYIFKHALTQEVAYDTVLQERRKGLHEQTAQAIEALFPSRLEEHYSDLAHHYSRSGNTEKAVEYLQLAGQQAVQRSAYAEAISHLTAALELLKTLPDTVERAQQEIVLQLTLGKRWLSPRGMGSQKWKGPMPVRGSCVSRWGSPSSSLQRCWGCIDSI